MLAQDEAEFEELMLVQAEIFDRDLAPATIEVWREDLNKFSLAQIKRAFSVWREENSKFPRPAQIKEILRKIRGAVTVNQPQSLEWDLQNLNRKYSQLLNELTEASQEKKAELYVELKKVGAELTRLEQIKYPNGPRTDVYYDKDAQRENATRHIANILQMLKTRKLETYKR